MSFRRVPLRALALSVLAWLACCPHFAAAQYGGPAAELSRLPDINQAPRAPEIIGPGRAAPGGWLSPNGGVPVAPPPAANVPPAPSGEFRAESGAAVTNVPQLGGNVPPTANEYPSLPGESSGPTVLGTPQPLWDSICKPPSQGQNALAYGPNADLPWSWHALPTGLMYRSYLAGVKEPRLGTMWMSDSRIGPHHDTRLDTGEVGTVWDSNLGGRVGILRYGTPNGYRPEGFQVDLAGSAQPRLNPYGSSTPLLACDYIVSLPVTYARGAWQFKTGYNHLSSHMGDELLVNNPALLAATHQLCARFDHARRGLLRDRCLAAVRRVRLCGRRRRRG